MIMAKYLSLIFVLCLAASTQVDADQGNPRYRCDGNKCVLLPQVASMPEPVAEPMPSASISPTLACSGVTYAEAAQAKPVRSVLVRPVRRAANVVQGVRDAKPVRRVLGFVFRRRCS